MLNYFSFLWTFSYFGLCSKYLDATEHTESQPESLFRDCTLVAEGTSVKGFEVCGSWRFYWLGGSWRRVSPRKNNRAACARAEKLARLNCQQPARFLATAFTPPLLFPTPLPEDFFSPAVVDAADNRNRARS